MKVCRTYFDRQGRCDHRVALVGNRGRKYTEVVVFELPLRVLKVDNRVADGFVELPGASLKRAQKSARELAGWTYGTTKRSAVPAAMRAFLF